MKPISLAAFDYHLPEEKIAQQPVEPRDHSRLLRLNRQQQTLTDHHFYDLPTLLETGDLLVINNTRVLPVRLFGQKTTGAKAEILLTKKISARSTQVETWEALTKPGLKPGQQVLVFASNSNQPSSHQPTSSQPVLKITCLENQGYSRIVEVEVIVTTTQQTNLNRKKNAETSVLSTLAQVGQIPTPPYIKEFVGDPERYQTVFASQPGSAAAPTAGLHFTPELLAKLKNRGISLAEITLDVGLGTFLHVTTTNIADHHMHSERFTVTQNAADQINQALQAKRRVIAVGTTSLRTLEAAAVENKSYPKGWSIQAQNSQTDLFLYPPYKFKIVDALITNYHLPKSTLLMLVSAFTSHPQSTELFTNFSSNLLGKAYQQAIINDYRFFSFGDAMLIE